MDQFKKSPEPGPEVQQTKKIALEKSCCSPYFLPFEEAMRGDPLSPPAGEHPHDPPSPSLRSLKGVSRHPSEELPYVFQEAPTVMTDATMTDATMTAA